MATSTMAQKTTKLGLMPTLVVLILVLGLAIFVGVILLMMLVRTGIEHSPEHSKVEQHLLLLCGKDGMVFPSIPEHETHEG